MSLSRVGFVTIGQSPRTDILGELGALLQGLEVIEAGALDRLARDELSQVAPEGGKSVFVSRLRDGSQIILSKKKVLPLLQRAIEAVVDQGAGVVVVLCTGEFPQLACPAPIIFPDRIVTHFVQAILPAHGKLGILVPLADQKAMAERRWRAVCADLLVSNASPYLGFDEALGTLSEMKQRDLVIMDCMGYSQRQRARVRRLVNAPVVLPKTLVARVVQELM